MTDTAFKPPTPSKSILQMPKCNLHTHLEGSIRPATYIELARDQNISIPDEIEQVEQNLQVSGKERSLVDYLNKIMVNYPVLRSYAALKRTAYEAAEDAFLDGVIYLEIRAGPVTHSGGNLPVEMCIEAILEGLKDAEKQLGIINRLIVTGLRNHNPKHNILLAEIAKNYQLQGVVGFDLAGDEANYPADLHKKAFHIIRDSNLGITVHAGEAAGFENVQYAINVIGASRIGHGVHIIDFSSTMELVRDKQVLLEICPTSNIHTGAVTKLELHPVKKFFDFEIPISIGDDDPITSRTRVSNELMLLKNVFGFSKEDLKAIQIDSIKHSFLKEENIKKSLLQKIYQFNY